jgi:hypothetical protein
MKIHNINPGIIAEWMSLIDPQSSNDRDYESKVAAIIKSQADLLLNSEMTEIRSKHWIITKQAAEDGNTVLEFSLIAYSAKSEIPSLTENEFNQQKIKLLRNNLKNALAREDYLKAAEVRDLLKSLGSGRDAA